jgi:hypothetical protein
LKQLSKDAFQQRLTDANATSKTVGNNYTLSVFLGLASLLDRCGGDGSRAKPWLSFPLAAAPSLPCTDWKHTFHHHSCFMVS